jgi:hypothetical protein
VRSFAFLRDKGGLFHNKLKLALVELHVLQVFLKSLLLQGILLIQMLLFLRLPNYEVKRDAHAGLVVAQLFAV